MAQFFHVIIFLIIFLPVLFIALAVYMYKEAFADRVVCHSLAFPGFPESFKKLNIFFISDIHRRLITEQIIQEAKGKTDMVIIGGDLLERGVPLERVEKNIIKLKELGPVFFVRGNNDYEIDDQVLDELLHKHEVTILSNTAVGFESPAGERLVLLGVDDFGKKRDRLDLAIQAAGEGGFRILVSHNPGILRKIKPEHKIDLVLSGHTHGGQIRIFGFGPYEKGGIKIIAGITLFVSNGYGTTLLPLRLGTKAETHILVIKKDLNSNFPVKHSYVKKY